MGGTYSKAELQLYGFSMILAPTLFFLSTFYWTEGEYGVKGGTLLNLSFIFWIPVLIALFSLLKEKMPRYAAWGLLVSLSGCIVGANFGMVGVNGEVFGISHATYIAGYSKFPLSSNLFLFALGPVFPFSLLLLSIQLLRTGSLPALLAILLGIGSILFPFGRILRISLLAHAADLLILVPLVMVGISFLRNTQNSGKKLGDGPIIY